MTERLNEAGGDLDDGSAQPQRVLIHRVLEVITEAKHPKVPLTVFTGINDGACLGKYHQDLDFPASGGLLLQLTDQYGFAAHTRSRSGPSGRKIIEHGFIQAG
jgi:hypothetical protein